MDPTVEPDPDNAGGGKKTMQTTPSAEGVFFTSSPISPIRLPSIQTKPLQEVNMWISRTLTGCLLLLVLVGIAGAKEKTPFVTLMTHDSFAVSQTLLDGFRKQHGAEIKILKSGDAGAALNQAILSKKNPLADVFFGVDNTFMSRALSSGIFEPYESPFLRNIPDSLKLDPSYRLLPVDYGDVCLNYDKSWFSREGLAPPRGLADLIKPVYKGLTVVQNPATSSPGLAFLITTVGKYGEKGYLDFWRQLRRNEVYITAGWSEAYYGQFTRAKGGTRPIVVSYASSPAAEVYYSEKKLADTPTAGVLSAGSAFRQIEFVGILTNTEKADLARKLVDFMLSPAFQKEIPLHMWVFPANPETPMPDVFLKYAQKAEAPIMLLPEAIENGREAWIEAWTDTVLR
jgi:thiamine transport system substrate-binding protein